jgi:hypothetical protein
VTSQLAGLTVQIGDHDAARAYAERALTGMQSLGAVEDTMQLQSMLTVLDIQAGRLDDAERQLAEIAADDRNQSALGGTLVMRCGAAELALARGDQRRGLELYREAVGALREISIPGLPLSVDFTPWVLYPEAGALSAHARAGAHAESQELRDGLASKTLELLAGDRGFMDYPLAGALLYALALWELSDQRRTGRWEPAVRLLALADGFAYNQTLPSLSWAYAAAAADERCPGLLSSCREELTGRRAVELRDDVRRLVAELTT